MEDKEVINPGGRAGPGASEGFFRNSQQQLQTSLVCVTLISFLVQQYHINTGHIGFATRSDQDK